MNKIVNHLESIYRKVYESDDFIPLHAPVFRGNEKKYLNECIESTFVSSVGKYVDRFQEELSSFCGARYAVAVANGTSALHLSFIVNGVAQNDEVICPDITFVATAAAIVYTGAKPIFLDIEDDSFGLCPEKLELFLKSQTIEFNGKRINKQTGNHIKACVVMHNVGFPSKINKLVKICEEYNLILIEDAAEALGSSLENKMPGTFGRVGILSFNGNKIITSGGGGAIITDSEEIFKKNFHLSTTAKVSHPYKYVHDEIGYNYRMPNINAALALAQLENIDNFLKIKQEQVNIFYNEINCKDFQILRPKHGQSNNWFTIAKIDEKNINIDAFIKALSEKGIMARPLWSKISNMEPYRHYQKTSNEISDMVLKNIICLPNGVAK